MIRIAAVVALLALAPAARGATYGAAMPEGASTPVAQLLLDPAPHEGATVKLSGRFTQVCQKTGCWLMLESNGEAVRVKTGHAFFLPKNATGTAVVHGQLSAATLSEAQARHYVDDGSEAAKTGREWQVLATSIVIEP